MTLASETERASWQLLRAAFRLARGRDRRALVRLALRQLDAGAADWHRWRLTRGAPRGLRLRATRRVGIACVARALAGSSLEACRQGDWIVGGEAYDLTGRPDQRRSDALALAVWWAHRLARGRRLTG